MNLSIMFFINSILLGVGLAMDAFSASLANGLNDSKMRSTRMTLIAGVFAGFQAAMPMIGWICVHTVVQYFSMFQKAIPWIALILLVYIGGKMLLEGIKNDSEEGEVKPLSMTVLMVQGIATSIDALSVGFTIAHYGLMMAIICALIISIVTFIICMMGLVIGKRVGTGLSGKANIFGGVILILIGIEIFVTGIL